MWNQKWLLLLIFFSHLWFWIPIKPKSLLHRLCHLWFFTKFHASRFGIFFLNIWRFMLRDSSSQLPFQKWIFIILLILTWDTWSTQTIICAFSSIRVIDRWSHLLVLFLWWLLIKSKLTLLWFLTFSTLCCLLTCITWCSWHISFALSSWIDPCLLDLFNLCFNDGVAFKQAFIIQDPPLIYGHNLLIQWLTKQSNVIFTVLEENDDGEEEQIEDAKNCHDKRWVSKDVITIVLDIDLLLLWGFELHLEWIFKTVLPFRNKLGFDDCLRYLANDDSRDCEAKKQYLFLLLNVLEVMMLSHLSYHQVENDRNGKIEE